MDFEDIKYSGYKHFHLPDEIFDTNIKRLSRYQREPMRKIVPKSDRDIFIFYIGEFLFSPKIKLTPTKLYLNQNDIDIITFITDNSSGAINFLPKNSCLRISSFFFSDWDVEEEEIRKCIQTSKSLTFRIENGILVFDN